MDKVLVSIIVPVYNVERYIKRGIESLLNQTLKNIEIILIDDGSTDNSRKICEKYANKDTRVNLIVQKNLGVSHARNLGIENALGDYIIFMDPDDEIDLRMCEILYSTMQKDDCDLVLCNFYKVIKEKKLPIILNYPSKLNNSKEIKSLILDMIGNEIYGEETVMGCIWRGLYKKDFLLKHNIKFPQNIRPMQDLIFMIEYLSKCKSVNINKECLYYYYVNPNSAVTGYKKNLWDNNKKVCQLVQELLQKNNFDSITKQRFAYFRIFCTDWCLFNEIDPLNNISKKEKIKHMSEFINNQEVRISIRQVSLKNVKASKKILLILIRLGNSTLVYYYLLLIRKLKKIFSRL